MSDYETLKAYGHSPAKAAEIVLDAKRGDYFCTSYIAFVRNSALAAGARGDETLQAAQSEGRQSGAAEQRNAQGTQP